MLTIKKPSEKPCFMTGSVEDCFEVKFSDGSFQGVISWSALLAILRQRLATPGNSSNSSERARPFGDRNEEGEGVH